MRFVAHADLILHVDRLTVALDGQALQGLPYRVAGFAARCGAQVEHEGGTVTIRSPQAEHLRDRLAIELRHRGVVVTERDAEEWPVVELDAGGRPLGIVVRSRTKAGNALLEQLRSSLSEAERGHSGAYDGALWLGCEKGGQERLVGATLRWLLARGATVRMR